MSIYTPSAALDSDGSQSEVQTAFVQILSSQVGRRSLASVSEELRRTMLLEALRRSKGNLTYTGKLLGTTRQAVQQMLTALDLKPWVEELRNERRHGTRPVVDRAPIDT